MKKKKSVFLYVFILFYNISFSQTPEDETRYLQKLNKFTDSNNDSLLFYAKKLQNSKNLCHYFSAVNKEAKAYYQKGDLNLAKEKTLLVLDRIKNETKECFKKNEITALLRLFWIYKNQNHFQDAFEVLIQRKEVINSLNNKDNYYSANLVSTEHNLAIIKSVLGFDKEARTLLKKTLPKLPAIYKDLNKNDYYLKLNISSTLNIIGESYLKTSKDNSTHLDSASIYFKRAYKVAENFNPPHKNSEVLYQLREAQVLIGKEDFKNALNLIERFEKNSEAFKTTQNINSLKAICYYKLGNADSSFLYCNQFLSNYAKKPNLKNRLIAIYDILANQYYTNQQLDSAFKYSERTIKEITALNNHKNDVNKAYYLYDFKNAQKLNNSILEKEKKKRFTFIIILIIVGVVLFLVLYFLIKKNRKINTNLREMKLEVVENLPTPKKVYNIDEKLENTLLAGISAIEKSKDFLKPDFNINVLAKKLNTNTSYLSYLINQESNQSFKQYITQLRIEYLIRKLKDDSKFRNYTIKSLAEEIGYTNASAFTRAFKKYKGVTPSEFIKSLE